MLIFQNYILEELMLEELVSIIMVRLDSAHLIQELMYMDLFLLQEQSMGSISQPEIPYLVD